MDSAVLQRHPRTVLPEISSKPRKNTQYSSITQEKKLVQTGVSLDKSAKILSKREISLFRNSLKHNMCVQLLQQGFHRSFSELFFLLGTDRQRRVAAAPGSAVTLQTPLEQQWDKLETLQHHLTRAEQAERTGSWTVVCDQRLLLGRYFSAPEDSWLSLHFYHSCAERQQGGFSRPAAEARACMAEVYLQLGELEQARQQAELCVQQAEDSGWADSSGRPLELRSCRLLWRIYSRLADALLGAGSLSGALELLHKGLSMAAQSEDKQMEGEASYQLGLTYQSAGDQGTARQFFSASMQIGGTLQDADMLTKSYKAMAKSIESEGNTEDTLQCLEQLAFISRSNGLQHNLADAFLGLGRMYYSMSQFSRACEFFWQSYEVACNLEDLSLLSKAQVLLAAARARCLIAKFSADVESASPAALRRLLGWKEAGRGAAESPAAAAWD